MKRIAAELTDLLNENRYKFVALGILLLLMIWAAFSASRVSYSIPQDNAAKQWLIEYKTGGVQVELTMQYTR